MSEDGGATKIFVAFSASALIGRLHLQMLMPQWRTERFLESERNFSLCKYSSLPLSTEGIYYRTLSGCLKLQTVMNHVYTMFFSLYTYL